MIEPTENKQLNEGIPGANVHLPRSGRAVLTDFLSAAPGFAAVLGASVIALAVMFILLWKKDNEYSAHTTFGISDVLARHVLTSFTPMVAVTAVTLRNLFLLGAGVGQDAVNARQRDPLLRRIPGVGRLYAIAILGIAAAASCLVYISFPSNRNNGQLVIGVAATVWAGTLTHILATYFRQSKTRK